MMMMSQEVTIAMDILIDRDMTTIMTGITMIDQDTTMTANDPVIPIIIETVTMTVTTMSVAMTETITEALTETMI